jgi:hypothetical protein
MCDEIVKHLAKCVDDVIFHLGDITAEDVEAGLARAGLRVTTIHSGKKLSEVPYEHIYIGMQVTGWNGADGVVDQKYDKSGDDKDNTIRIEWTSCSQTAHWHQLHHSVTVK